MRACRFLCEAPNFCISVAQILQITNFCLCDASAFYVCVQLCVGYPCQRIFLHIVNIKVVNVMQFYSPSPTKSLKSFLHFQEVFEAHL